MASASADRVPSIARWLLVAVVSGSILLASVVPAPDGSLQPLGPLGLVGLDAWFHALAYAGLAASLLYALEPSDGSPMSVLGLALVLAIAFGFAVELVQVPVPTRQFERFDLVANGVGATAAVVAWLGGSRLPFAT